MTTRARMWAGLLVSAVLFSAWMLAGFLLSAEAPGWSGRAGLFLTVLLLQVTTSAAIFYTASKVTLHRYEVIFEERLKAQVQEMNRRIDEMKRIVQQVDIAFRERSQALAEEVSAAVREALSGEQNVS